MDNEVFVIRNQHGHYWGKGDQWVDGHDARRVFRRRHHDEALNTLVELNSRDIELRGRVEGCPLDGRGEPSVLPSEVPLPLFPEAAEDEPRGDGLDAGRVTP